MIEGKEVISPRGAVAAHPAASARVGAEILEAGGNAVDAVVAAGFAGFLLDPAMAGVGGYVGTAVVLDGKTDQVWSVDSGSTAPAAAREDMFETVPLSARPQEAGSTPTPLGAGINADEYECSVPENANVVGSLAVAVPGVMACVGTVWERWGRLEWAQIVEPSLQLLRDGHQLKGPGIEHLPEIEGTLAHLAKAGWRDFYDGELGRTIADALQDAGGILTRDDMAGYDARVNEGYTTTYRGATVTTPILPNGGLSTLQALNILECFDPLPDDRVEYWHLLTEVLKIVWRDRLELLADPDFADVPVDRLLSNDYARECAARIGPFPSSLEPIEPRPPAETAEDTFHFSSADTEGNAVSITLSHGGGFGSQFIVPGAGLVLGHGMCRFDPRPGLRNSIAPGKRPLNNTSALLVRTPDRDIATGLPGGRRIISVSPRLVQHFVDSGRTSLEAATAPRLHTLADGAVEVRTDIDPKITEALQSAGHNVKSVQRLASRAHSAEILRKENKVRAGGDGGAAGA